MMHASQCRSVLGRMFLVAVAVSMAAACDQPGNPLAPGQGDRAVGTEAAANTVRRPPVSYGTPMTREEARTQGIEHARAALAGARSGAVTGLSDGRKLTRADAVRLWERTLHALKSGSSLMHLLGTADASSGTELASVADGFGYVWGTTNLNRQWAYANVTSLTLGDGAQSTFVSGDLEVFLSRTSSHVSQSRSEYKMYVAYAQGDFVTGEVQIDWDYNWIAEYAIAATNHSADYVEYQATTTSSAAN